MASALKLERFDKKLLKLLEESGECAYDDVFRQFHVAREDFDKRLKILSRNKLVHFPEAGKIVLGLKGFNALEAKQKREKKAAEKAVAIAEALKEGEKAAEEKPEPQTSLPRAVEKAEKPIIESQIFEIPANAGPTQPAFQPSAAQRPAQPRPSTSKVQKQAEDEPLSQQVEDAGIMVVTKGPATPIPKQVQAQIARINEEWEKAQESCELCKAAFKLSVNKAENNPLYGHCFCGAAYHKDCYEAVADDGGKCVRCGRMIKKVLDKTSIEALKGLRNAFD